MITLAIIHSNTRMREVELSLKYLSNHPDFSRWQKIIINDGPVCLTSHTDFKIINVMRSADMFCRADIWTAAVESAVHDILVILDGDRLPHYEFFDNVKNIRHKDVMYCEYLMQPLRRLDYGEYVDYINNLDLNDKRFKRDVRYVVAEGTVLPKKNPMSGCVAFHTADYHRWGGMSRLFKAWGFNDVDCYYRSYLYGCDFKSVKCPEIHIFHDREIPLTMFLSMNAYNGVLFYDTWRLPVHEDVLSLLERLKMPIRAARSYDLLGFVNLSTINGLSS